MLLSILLFLFLALPPTAKGSRAVRVFAFYHCLFSLLVLVLSFFLQRCTRMNKGLHLGPALVESFCHGLLVSCFYFILGRLFFLLVVVYMHAAPVCPVGCE